MPQIAYAHSVREFIRELLKRFIPGKWIDRAISDSDKKFDAKLDAAFAALDEKTATERDYCGKVVSVLCDEVSEICEVTHLVCVNRGYRKYAETFLSSEKFIRLLLRQDLEKLERLNAAMSDASKPLCVLLREIGAVLEDKSSDDGAAFGAAEAKKANAELKAIAADVKKTIKTGFKEVKRDIATIGQKVSQLNRTAKRNARRTYDERKIAAVKSVWALASKSEEARRSLNTRMTYLTALRYGKAILEEAGITTHEEFAKIKRAIICRESRARIKEHEARQDKARRKSAAKAGNKTSRKNGIMSGNENGFSPLSSQHTRRRA